ncbi:MAG: hypothetical protein WAW79_05975, partial [Steroidobacteraceae bacterium]
MAPYALLILTALLEIAMPALRSRRLPARRPGDRAVLRLRRRFATEPRRARRAAWLLRITLLVALLLALMLTPVENRMTVALV